MATAEYLRYLESREWARLRTAVRERSGGTCERPGCRRRSSSVHHLTYERIYHELLTDLLDVCEPCHLYLSGKLAFDPAGPPRGLRVIDVMRPRRRRRRPRGAETR